MNGQNPTPPASDVLRSARGLVERAADQLSSLIRARHQTAHRGDIYDGGLESEKCALCKPVWDLIAELLTPAALAAPAPDGPGVGVDACGHRYGWCCDFDFDRGTYRTTNECIGRTMTTPAPAPTPPGLTEAWAAVEAVLPEGWVGPALGRGAGGWRASVSPISDGFPSTRSGPTPTDALLALAAALAQGGTR